MLQVEKNDVDINQLFNWGRVFEIYNPKSKKVDALVYMRVLGDADANKARVYAIRKSGELRRKLLDPNSDECIAIIRTIDELAESDLKNYIIIFSMRDIQNEAIRNVKIKVPTPPKSNASLAKLEKYQEEIDTYHARLRTAIEKHTKKEVDVLLKSLDSFSKEELYRKYKSTLIDEFCEKEAFKAYTDMEIYLGCYKDDQYKDKFFESFEQFDNLETSIKADFQAAYSNIKIDMDELKKLRAATL